jgi:hypothetical protein
MSIDHNLIHRANKLAGQHIHKVSNLICMYQEGIVIGTDETIQVAKEAEIRLRLLLFELESLTPIV